MLKQPVDVPHGMFAQPWIFGAFRTVAAEALAFLQEISDLFHRQFRERYIPQSGENVVFEDITMGCVCGRTALVLVVDLLPAENIVFQRHIPTSMHWRCRFRNATHGSPACFRIRLCRQ